MQTLQEGSNEQPHKFTHASAYSGLARTACDRAFGDYAVEMTVHLPCIHGPGRPYTYYRCYELNRYTLNFEPRHLF